jgi:hypothetical protein
MELGGILPILKELEPVVLGTRMAPINGYRAYSLLEVLVSMRLNVFFQDWAGVWFISE